MPVSMARLNTHPLLLLCSFFFGTCCGHFNLAQHEGSTGKLWILLASGSKGWLNYRHQADIYHAYQIIKQNGIPDENIILMVNDDIAYNDKNPTPGVIIDYPGGPNVYEGLLKDYTGLNVTPMNFLNILSGNKTVMKGIESGKVIESGPDDVIFVNFVGHGTQGVLMFPNDQLFADDFLDVIKNMKDRGRFSKMVMYIEACFSGSLFDNMLSDDMNVLVVTSADSREPSTGCFRDDEKNTWLSNVFSSLWMNFVKHPSYSEKNLHHLYENVRSYTNTSHPQEYGDLDIGGMKLKNILGQRKRSTKKRIIPYTPFPMDVVNSIDIPLLIISEQRKATTDPQKRKQLKWEQKNLIERRKSVDHLFNHIMEKVANNVKVKMEELRTKKLGLNKENFKCYKALYTTFSNYCMNPSMNPYSRLHFQKLVNMCSVDWLSQEEANNDIESLCKISFGSMKPRDVI